MTTTYQEPIIQVPLRRAENLARGVITRVETHDELEFVAVEMQPVHTLLVGHLLTPALRVAVPFLVTFEHDEGNVVASAPVFNEFGFGLDRNEALRDLQRAIEELYLELEERQDRLGPDLAATWDALRKHLLRRR